MDSTMTSVFYDPQNRQITVAVESISEAMMTFEEDGSILFSFENVEDIEFYWPDERIWRAVQ